MDNLKIFLTGIMCDHFTNNYLTKNNDIFAYFEAALGSQYQCKQIRKFAFLVKFKLVGQFFEC